MLKKLKLRRMYRIFKAHCTGQEITDTEYTIILERLFQDDEVKIISVVALKDIISLLPIGENGEAVTIPIVFINNTTIQAGQTFEVMKPTS